MTIDDIGLAFGIRTQLDEPDNFLADTHIKFPRYQGQKPIFLQFFLRKNANLSQIHHDPGGIRYTCPRESCST